jgi:release factor glutamine methyltransferase
MSAETEEPWTIQRVLNWSSGWLAERGHTDSPRLDAELLLCKALGLKRLDLYVLFDRPLTPGERDSFRALLKRRGEGEPVAYITGVKEFMGLRFAVSPAVLIPRPDTEIVVEAALAELGAVAAARGTTAEGEAWRILDVGTGSGCIAIALASRLPKATVEAWDVSDAALDVARQNGAALGVAERFHACKKDALDSASWDGVGPFDLVISNPPYIPQGERDVLPRSVVAFEPSSALFAGADGMTFYRELAAMAPRVLGPEGRLVVEIGALVETPEPAACAVFEQAGWPKGRVKRDYGKKDRAIVFTPSETRS